MIRALLFAIRFKTLTAGVAPVVVATTLVVAQRKPVLWWVSGLALMGALLIQMATNLFNDAIDFEKGADTKDRIGPTRVTASGQMTQRQVYGIASLMLFFALVCGIPLVYQGGLVVVGIGLISMFLAYGYTGGPLPLAYWGLGDIFVILFFGLIAVGVTHYLHTFELLTSDALVAGLQTGLLATVLIAINNFRDMDQDRLVDKKTWAVRFGARFVRIEIAILVGLTFLLNFYWLTKEWWLAGLLPVLLIWKGYRLVRSIFIEPPSPRYNDFLGHAAQLQLLFTVSLSLGFVFESLV